jgi:hypothetical protein
MAARKVCTESPREGRTSLGAHGSVVLIENRRDVALGRVGVRDKLDIQNSHRDDHGLYILKI